MIDTTPRIHIGLVIYNTSQSFWALMEQGIRTVAQQHGVRLTIKVMDSSVDQVRLIHEIVAEPIDLLIITPHDIYTPAFGHAIAQVQAAGIPIIACEAGYLGAMDFASSHVYSDLVQAANLATAYLAERVGGCGTLLQVRGDPSVPRSAGFAQALPRYPQIQAVDALTDWSIEDSRAATRAALEEHPDIAAIFAHNDRMALGALQALEECGRTGQVLVAGVDAIPEALLAIVEQRMAASVYINPTATGRTAVETALRVLRGEPVPAVIETPVTLVTRDTFLEVALEELAVLPTIIATLADSTMTQHMLQDAIIDAQHRQIRELSTPIMPISDTILVLPLVGTIDSTRAQQILETMLHAIEKHRAQVLIVDITGVPLVDTQIAHHLLQAAQAVRLLGTTVILVGVLPEVAQTMVQLGVDFSQIIIQSTLQASLEYAKTHLSSSTLR